MLRTPLGCCVIVLSLVVNEGISRLKVILNNWKGLIYWRDECVLSMSYTVIIKSKV